MLKRVLGGLITALLLTTPVLAQSVMCWDSDIAKLSNTRHPNYPTITHTPASLFPPYVKLTTTHVQWGRSRSNWGEPKENIGDGFPRWKSIERDFRYNIKYNRNKKTLHVVLSPHTQGKFSSFLSTTFLSKVTQKTYDNCELLNSQSSFNTTVSNGASAFKQLSLCDRKYVQQFLKGQGLYSSVIDGLWGSGTAKAVSRASQKGKLRGLSNDEIITKLADNLVCD